jgi:hypothetical protein
MKPLPKKVELEEVPQNVASWNVAKIPGFVGAVLGRWQRGHDPLPERFFMIMCPQVEVNARGGLPPKVVELTDPRLRCRHFTGCQRPYFVVLLTGEEADQKRARVQALLPWSEGYSVTLLEDAVRLRFVAATEEVEDEPNAPRFRGRLQELLASGELVSILA